MNTRNSYECYLKEASENFVFDFADISNTMTSSDLERTYITSVDIFCNNANMFYTVQI